MRLSSSVVQADSFFCNCCKSRPVGSVSRREGGVVRVPGLGLGRSWSRQRGRPPGTVLPSIVGAAVGLPGPWQKGTQHAVFFQRFVTQLAKLALLSLLAILVLVPVVQQQQ